MEAALPAVQWTEVPLAVQSTDMLRAVQITAALPAVQPVANVVLLVLLGESRCRSLDAPSTRAELSPTLLVPLTAALEAAGPLQLEQAVLLLVLTTLLEAAELHRRQPTLLQQVVVTVGLW